MKISNKYIDQSGRLIHKSKNNTYKVLNDKNPYIITDDEFNQLEKKSIKTQEFSRLMNLFFKNVTNVTWVYSDVRYKKLPNFESNEYDLITNYDYKDLPRHDCGVYGNCILVYHWGRVYYFTISYNGYKQGQLLDVRTKSFVRWAQAKHCSPIKNLDTKKIM